MTDADYLYTLKGVDGIHYIMPNQLQEIDYASQFMRMVVYSAATYYKPNRFSFKGWNQISSIGFHLNKLLTYSELYSRTYHFSPLLDFFFTCYRSHPICTYAMTLTHNDIESIEIFDDFLHVLRDKAKLINLKAKVRDWESARGNNRKRLRTFEKQLFDRYARLMVVRLDFHYHSAVFSHDELNAIMNTNVEKKQSDLNEYAAGIGLHEKEYVRGKIALKEMQKDRKHFFANMKGKPSLFKHVVGYIWRIECSREGGYHMHVMLFFDGSQVQKHEYYAQEIGNYWNDVITKGRGYFYNCNFNRTQYGKRWALGQVNHDDKAKRTNLLNTMLYLAKSEQAVHVAPYKGCHFFGSGFTKRIRGRGGRPRKVRQEPE